MKIKTKVKAGGIGTANHNQTVARGLKVNMKTQTSISKALLR